MMLRSPLSFAFALSGSLLFASEPPEWAGRATSLRHFAGTPGPRVPSPDGRYVAVANDDLYTLNILRRSDGSRVNREPIFALSSLSELEWAPDSSAFFITSSEGGSVGTWSVSVFRVSRTSVTQATVGATALADFKKRYPRCPDEYPNVVAVDWSGTSAQLLLAVEMPCHSSCQDMCSYLGYRIRVKDDAILEQLDESEVVVRWADHIGPRLRPAA
jgi:hypothetical protein